MNPPLKPERFLTVTAILLVLLCLYLAIKNQFLLLDFNIESTSAVVGKLTPPFLAALFVERAVEVILTIYRARDSARLQLELSQLPDPSEQRTAKERELLLFKAETQRVAFWVALAMGTLLAAAGVRALGSFLLFAPQHDFTLQQQFFAALDIVITGTVIAGGSDGLHKIISLLTDFLDKSRAMVNQTSPNPGPALMSGVPGAAGGLSAGAASAAAQNHVFDAGA